LPEKGLDAAASASPIRVGISSCLLGEAVRWDGSHKRDRWITDSLSPLFEWVPVCPEFEVGMGIPREPVRLTGDPAAPRMVGVKSGTDWTERMTRWAREQVRRLTQFDLCGYLLKSGSPSCGRERVRLYTPKGASSRTGEGLFASRLRQGLPLLPVEEERRIQDAPRRENFIERVFAYRRWRDRVDRRCRRSDLVTFHADHKYLVLSHSPARYRALRRLIAATDHAPSRLATLYGETFMAALRIPTTAGRHRRVLQDISGLLEPRLDDFEKRQLREVLEDYRRGGVPLFAPLTLLRHLVVRHDVGELRDQVYLKRRPEELVLRNCI
jgi:uncharacterized protein YbbK (DUF523 family)/uncharacterized protein YbgA (DUF1722 family)